MLADESPRTYLNKLSEIRVPGVAVKEASSYEFPPINFTKNQPALDSRSFFQLRCLPGVDISHRVQGVAQLTERRGAQEHDAHVLDPFYGAPLPV
jgi:hypothetical protein